MSPFLRPAAPGIDEALADGAVAVLRDRGVDALNVAALARWMGVSRQALSERLWDENGPRRRILRLTVLAFADRWLRWVELALLEDPPVPALPRTEEEVHGLRVWAALAELARGEHARGNPVPAQSIAATRGHERDAVRCRVGLWMGAGPTENDVIELIALTDGLRAGLIAPTTDLTVEMAHGLLLRRLRHMRGLA